MPALSDYVAGTITLTNGSTAFTGTGTGWLAADFREGDTIFQVAGQTQWDAVIASIDSNTAGTLALPWGGASGTYNYRMRYMADGARVTAQARNLIELLGNGNLQALAGLTGPGVVVFNGPHAMVVKPEADFVNGVYFNASVATFADRSAYDAQPGPTGNAPGFTVLVRQDVNFDNKTTLYSKLSDTSGDWSTAAVITGDIGEMPTIDIAPTVTLPPGSLATVESDPIAGGYELTFSLPAGRGPIPKGTYNPATAYVLDDAVLDNGSTWILIIPTSTGNAPPVLPTTSNTQWQLLARAGLNGTGIGDVIGPASSTADAFVLFDGTSGKLIKDSGKTFATLADFQGYIPQGRLTLTSNQPIQVANAFAATVLYYTPFTGERVSLWNGVSNFENYLIPQLSLTLSATHHLIDKIHDLYLVRDAGVIYLATGPAWAGDNLRGTGAASAEIETVKGVKVNKNAITVRPFNTPSNVTIAVPARQGTVVGWVRTSAAGQTEYSIAPTPVNGGTNNKLFLGNAYNKAVVVAREIDLTASWSSVGSSIRAMNGSNSNRISFIMGDIAEVVEARLASMVLITTSGAFPVFGIAIDSTSVFASEQSGGRVSGAVPTNFSASPEHFASPGIGLHYVQAIESNLTGTAALYLGGDQYRFTAKLAM